MNNVKQLLRLIALALFITTVGLAFIYALVQYSNYIMQIL
jgi:hypothetical protein